MATRKYYNARFKAQVALDALKNNATIAELSAIHGVHPTQIQTWKAELEKNADALFAKDNENNNSTERQRAELERKVGQLTIENDFLKKNYAAYLRKIGS